jgi:hypothetical protein
MTTNETTDQINKLLAQSSDALLCGPDCQKIRKTGLLRQNYLDAQANMETAPFQLEEAEKNYYTYQQGDAGYTTIRKKQLEEQASKIIEKTTVTFDSEIDSATELATTYENVNITYENMQELYEKYLEENKQFQKQFSTLRGDTITNDRQSFYESQGYDTLNNWYILWKWIYGCIVAVYIIGLFLSSSNYSLINRIIILIFLIVYPFIIQPVYHVLYNIINTIYSYLPKNAYTRV